MQRSDFHYDLPAELIAQVPLAERRASRLLVLDGAAGLTDDRLFAELPRLLKPDDLLVFNDTRVITARLFGGKPTGGAVERWSSACCPRRVLAQLRASHKPPPGGEIRFAEVDARVRGRARPGELVRAALAREPLP